MKKNAPQWIAGRKVLLSPTDTESHSTTWQLMQLIEDLGKEGLSWVEEHFGGYARKELDLQVASTPVWGDWLELECRFQWLDRKHGRLKVNSFVKEGKKSVRRAQLVYELRLGGM